MLDNQVRNDLEGVSWWDPHCLHWDVHHYSGLSQASMLLIFRECSFPVLGRRHSLTTDLLILWLLQCFCSWDLFLNMHRVLQCQRPLTVKQINDKKTHKKQKITFFMFISRKPNNNFEEPFYVWEQSEMYMIIWDVRNQYSGRYKGPNRDTKIPWQKFSLNSWLQCCEIGLNSNLPFIEYCLFCFLKITCLKMECINNKAHLFQVYNSIIEG